MRQESGEELFPDQPLPSGNHANPGCSNSNSNVQSDGNATNHVNDANTINNDFNVNHLNGNQGINAIENLGLVPVASANMGHVRAVVSGYVANGFPTNNNDKRENVMNGAIMAEKKRKRAYSSGVVNELTRVFETPGT